MPLTFTCTSGHPTFDAMMQEVLALQAFVQGLQPEQLQEHICLSTPQTHHSPSTKHRVHQADHKEIDEEGVTCRITISPSR